MYHPYWHTIPHQLGYGTATIIWGVIKTHIAMSDMLIGDLCNQTIVTSNYAKWLVNHSRKKDANDLKKDVDRLTKSISDIALDIKKILLS